MTDTNTPQEIAKLILQHAKECDPDKTISYAGLIGGITGVAEMHNPETTQSVILELQKILDSEYKKMRAVA